MNEAVKSAKGAGPFSYFERMVAWRYLRSKRKETVISVIASISFIGIMLGVATLIIVMAVMNGFRAELLTRILGINGHLIMQPVDTPLDDYEAVTQRIAGVPGVKLAMPLIEGQIFASGQIGPGSGRAGEGHSRRRSRQGRAGRQQHQAGLDRRLRQQRRCRDRHPNGGKPRAFAGRFHFPDLARRRRHAARHDAEGEGLPGSGDLRDRHVGIRRVDHLHAAGRGAALFQPGRPCADHRDLRAEPGFDRPAQTGGGSKPPSARSIWRTGASATRLSSPLCRWSAT